MGYYMGDDGEWKYRLPKKHHGSGKRRQWKRKCLVKRGRPKKGRQKK